MRWTDDHSNPAEQPLIEAGQGVSEGFELAEEELVEHASHGDSHGTGLIGRQADRRVEEQPDDVHGEADEEHRPDA